MAQIGRPPKKGEVETLKLAVPKPLYDYLTYLATTSMIGASENEVAKYLLTQRLEAMLSEDYHDKQIPT